MIDVCSINNFLDTYSSLKNIVYTNKNNNSMHFILTLFKFIKNYYLQNENNLEGIYKTF